MTARRISQEHWEVIQARTEKSFQELKEYALQQHRDTDIYFRPNTIENVFCVDKSVNAQSLRRLIRLLKTLDCVIGEEFFDTPPTYSRENPFAGALRNDAAQNVSREVPVFGPIPNHALALQVVNPVEQSRIVKNVSGIYTLYRQKGDHTGPTLEWLIIERMQKSDEVFVYWITAKRRIYVGPIYKCANAAHVTFYRPHHMRGFSCRQMMLNVPSGNMGETKINYLSGALTRTKSSDVYPMTSNFIVERVDKLPEHIDEIAGGAATFFNKRRRGEIDDTAADHYGKFRSQICAPDYVPDLAESYSIPPDRNWIAAELQPAIETCSPNQLREKITAEMALKEARAKAR